MPSYSPEELLSLDREPDASRVSSEVLNAAQLYYLANISAYKHTLNEHVAILLLKHSCAVLGNLDIPNADPIKAISANSIYHLILNHPSLVNYKIDTADDSTPIIFAIYAQNAELVKFLLENNALADIPTNQQLRVVNSPLYLAIELAENGDYRIAEMLLPYVQDINRGKDWDTITPLHELVQDPKCDIQLLESMIRRGADVNVMDDFDATPFSDVCALDDCPQALSLLRVLRKNGAVMMQEAFGRLSQSPIHMAIKHGNFALVQELLSYAKDDGTLQKILTRKAPIDQNELHRTPRYVYTLGFSGITQ
ncbi:MAG UNVERIFIED_CONTAM: ankyrin repeat domain-containing protein [Rickettsiaceae bacterium]|jgi:ankyrin repeat protein